MLFTALGQPSLAPACPSPSWGAQGSSRGGDPDRFVPSCSRASTCWCDFGEWIAEGPGAPCLAPTRLQGGAGLGDVLCAWG